jgi:hypothetical protein
VVKVETLVGTLALVLSHVTWEGVVYLRSRQAGFASFIA